MESQHWTSGQQHWAGPQHYGSSHCTEFIPTSKKGHINFGALIYLVYFIDTVNCGRNIVVLHICDRVSNNHKIRNSISWLSIWLRKKAIKSQLIINFEAVKRQSRY